MIKGGISKRCPLFIPLKGGRALRARGKQRRRRCTNATPIFFPEKENGRRPPKRKAFRLAVSGLKGPLASGMQLPAYGEAALALRYDLPLLLSSAVAQPLAALLPYGCGTPPCGCRSAHLVEVRSNHHLPPVSTMRRAQQCRYFASSLPPSKRHSRLTIVRRG